MDELYNQDAESKHVKHSSQSGRPSHMNAPVPYHERVAVVVNGNAKQVNQDLIHVLDQIVQSGDLFVSRSLDEGQSIAETIVTRGYHTVLTGGGDGTFTQMVTWSIRAAQERLLPLPRFGLLRLGTGNALAWVLGATGARSGVIGDLARLNTEAGSRSLRLLEVGNTMSMFAGIGGDALALEHFFETKKQLGKLPLIGKYTQGALSYGVSIVTKTAPQMLFRPQQRIRIYNRSEDEAVKLGMDGEVVGKPFSKDELMFEGPARMVASSTIPYWGFGARIFPFASDREGCFSLRVVDISPFEAFTNLRAIWKGTHRSHRVHDFLADHVSVESDELMPLQVGGDSEGTHRCIDMRLSDIPIEVVDYYSPPENKKR